ncbi:MAG: alpha/beta fold hydrolase [Sphingobacteriales bacterium]|jgi:triacylglycerol lipase|nr:alpha/beta fold hydrolase [Sphingobacteriales bacterium]
MTEAQKLSHCDTKYPVILVSGLGFHDHNRVLHYWGLIPDHLKQHGCDVYTAHQEAFISIPDNALKLKFRILDILEKTKKDKINIIGHSKGGLEARYIASRLGMDEHISSITTLGSPHQGTHLADIILGRLPLPKFATARLVNLYATLMGDKRPDSLRAVVQVTTQSMKQFNEEVPDSSKVYYQSYASHVSKEYPNILWKTIAYIIRPYEGKNDGMVGIESCKWGNYRGLIQTDAASSVSHADMVGLTQFFGNPNFDARVFFTDVIHELKKMNH